MMYKRRIAVRQTNTQDSLWFRVVYKVKVMLFLLQVFLQIPVNEVRTVYYCPYEI